jgi:sterol desaturase/sphingolipid hydroxylase (fatty acid hydroxylase superfamily)
MPLYLMLIIVLLISGLTMAAYMIAFNSQASKASRIREEPVRKLTGMNVHIRMALNSMLSAAFFMGVCLGLESRLFYDAPAAWWRYPLEAVGVLVVYDFAYYFLHRFPFHEWDVLKRVHAVHHVAKFPTAIDSLYLHPVENIAGIALLMACTWLVGPISIYSFAALFFVYSQLNIAVHCGLDLKGPLAYFGLLARKHDHHHHSMRAGNFASITPIPDILFGTAQ